MVGFSVVSLSLPWKHIELAKSDWLDLELKEQFLP